MARARLVRCQRPGTGGVGAVGLLPAAVLLLPQLRYHEIGKFARIADQPRYVQVRSRLHGRFGFRRDTYAGVALRQADDLLADDDVFDLAKDGVVMIEQLVAVDGTVALEERDDVPIVAGVIAFLLRHQRRQRLHLVANVHVALRGLLDQIQRLRVHTPVAQRILVQGRRQAEVIPRARQDLGTNPVVVVPELPGQDGISLFPALEIRARQQLFDAVDHCVCPLQVLKHLAPVRADQAVDVEALGAALPGQLRKRLLTPGQAGVFVQPDDGRRVTMPGYLRIDETAHALEDGLAEVVIRQQVLTIQLRAAHAVFHGLDQDAEILQHAPIRFSLLSRAQLCQHGFRRCDAALEELRAEVDDILVDAVDAEAGRVLRIEFRHYLQHQACIFVAPVDPAAVGGECRYGEYYDADCGQRR